MFQINCNCSLGKCIRGTPLSNRLTLVILLYYIYFVFKAHTKIFYFVLLHFHPTCLRSLFDVLFKFNFFSFYTRAQMEFLIGVMNLNEKFCFYVTVIK